MTPSLRTNVIVRPRLMQLLDDAGAARTPCLVLAPSGYGKTTLLTQWAQQQIRAGRSVSWCGHAEIFEDCAADAVAADVLIVPGVSVADLPGTITSLLELTRNRPELHVVVGATGAAVPSAIDTDVWAVINELGFSESEVHELGEMLGSDSEQVEEAWAAAGPWPLGVRTHLQQGNLASLARGIHNAAAESGDRQLLGILSGVEQARPEVVSNTLGLPQADVTAGLWCLVNSGCVVEHEDVLGTHFSVRPGLRPYLLELRDVPVEVCAALRHANALAEVSSSPVAALETVLEIGELGEAEALCRSHFSEVLRGEGRALAALRFVPLNALDDYPTLLMCRLILERSQESIPIVAVDGLASRLNRAFNKERELRGDGAYASRLPMRIAVHRMLGMWDTAVALSYEMLELLNREKLWAGTVHARFTPISYAVASLTGLLVADPNLAAVAAGRGYQLAVEQDNPLEQVHALSLSALAYALQGDLEGAAHMLERADLIEAQQTLVHPEFSWVDGQLARIFVDHRRGDLGSARKHLDKLLPSMDRMEQWPMVVFAESLITSAELGAEDAFSTLLGRLTFKPAGREVSPAWQVMLECRKADLAIGVGRYADAELAIDKLDRNHELLKEAPGAIEVARARLYLYGKKYDQAVAASDFAADFGVPQHLVAHLQIVKALSLYGARDLEGASAAFAKLPWDGPADLMTLMGGVPYPLLVEAAEELGVTELAGVARDLPDIRKTVQYGTLSAAESEVLRALSEGRSMPETAESLFISPNTLKTHRRSIYQKLYANTRAEALTAARRIGLI